MNWMPMKQFCYEEAQRRGVKPGTVYKWLRGYKRPRQYPGVRIKKISTRTVDVGIPSGFKGVL